MGSLLHCALLCIYSFVFVSCYDDVHRSLYRYRSKPSQDISGIKSTNYSDYILPTNLKPTQQFLFIFPFLNNNTFQAQTFIMFDVISPTDQIVLNVRTETLQAGSIKASLAPVHNVKTPKIVNITIDQEHQMIRFKLNETLRRGQKGLSISIYFERTLATDMMGFYLSTYNTTDSQGVQTTHKMAITQFEATYARRAFPCFDEPSYRVNFTMIIVRSSNQSSMSNMPLNKTINYTDPSFVTDIYEPSPLMPTYLVAFGVSDLSNKSDEGSVRVFTRASAIEDATLALNVAQPILYAIGNFTKVPYPLKKMDIVTVPDFSAGAMENWGLTTFREKYVLYNPSKNTKKEWFGVVSVLAHEFGHQWFGDLVTPQWWTYTWLNEAFATYFEYTIPNQLYPELNIGSTMYIVDALQYALDTDIGSTRPMTTPVYTPDQIEAIFDYVIYEKGGSVLRMVENFLTTDVWKDGLNRYLKANSYATGNPGELFSALEAAANATNSSVKTQVTSTLISWTTQPGYPVVQLYKQSNSTYLITQSPYELASESLRWNIPITYTWQEDAQFDATKAARMLLNNTNQTVNINTTGWVILNVDQIGYFRVNYEDDNWSKIINQLKTNHSKIGAINRAQLIDDAFHLARTGHLNYSTAFAVSSYLAKETEYAPWNAFFTNMRFLTNQFYNTSFGEDLMTYARSIMKDPFQALTANLTTSTSSFLGSLTLQDAGQFACDVRLPACEQLTSVGYQQWTNDPNSIPPETRPAVICTQLRLDSDGKLFQTVLDYYLKSNNAAEKLAFMRAMGCLSSPTAINTYLNVVCDANANHVRLQDRFIAYNAIVSHQTGLYSGLQYLVNNYNKVSQALGSKVDSVFSTLGRIISQDTHIALVKRLLNDSSVDAGLKSKLQTLVLPPVVTRQSWASSTQATQLKQWLNNNTRSAASSIFANATYLLILYIVVTIW